MWTEISALDVLFVTLAVSVLAMFVSFAINVFSTRLMSKNSQSLLLFLASIFLMSVFASTNSITNLQLTGVVVISLMLILILLNSKSQHDIHNSRFQMTLGRSERTLPLEYILLRQLRIAILWFGLAYALLFVILKAGVEV